MHYFWIILIIAAASLLKGITGFGFALFSLPLLMNWYSPKELIPVLVFCNLFSSVIIILQKKERKLVNKEAGNLIAYAGFFTLIGVVVLKNISDTLLVTIMSISFIIMALFSILKVNRSFRFKNSTYKIAGMFLGILTGSISVSGPPLALFLNSAKVDKQEFREIFAWFSVVTAVIALAGYFGAGLIMPQMMKTTLLILPILFAGTYLGKRLNNTMQPELFRNITIVITIFSSILLLIK